jgi:phospholipid-binding lipoprotein MlaA
MSGQAMGLKGFFGSRSRAMAFALVAVVALSGCASNPQNPDDPFEDYNRTMFKINQRVDKFTFRPLARVYDTVAPRPVKIGVGNFFGNLGDLWIGANNMLQGKFADGVSDWMRFAFNSTWGIAGLLDIASEMQVCPNMMKTSARRSRCGVWVRGRLS